ncbi:DUF559 domain-containing protein [Georgenia yuyongxinii]|uniref:DUF559 domain-containing protein n=1 Tax=Georgenia yuyongxinii TaxID=2589797 RepID=UPI003AF88C17
MWLFHSVQPAELSSKDLRRRYLEYLLTPSREQDGLDIGEVSADERHPAFDSLFEQRVFLALRARGYRVRPQVKIGGYRIDLVVEGGTQRLAVECDGDAFHTEENRADDEARQRDLERVGWTFWRVRGSAFYRDPEAALASLWHKLDALEIQPALEVSTANEVAVQTHVEVDAQAPTDVEASSFDAAFALQPDRTGTSVSTKTPDFTEATASAMTDVPAPTPNPVLARPAATSSRPATKARESRTAPPLAPAPAPARAGADQRPRFRRGKMLLSAAARKRVQQETDAITAWLEDSALQEAAPGQTKAQLERTREREADLEGRLDYLTRVLNQSVAEPGHRGGEWVTPGCIVGLRINGKTDVEQLVVSTMPLGNVRTLNPFLALSQAIDGADLGATVAYETPGGVREAVIEEIID